MQVGSDLRRVRSRFVNQPLCSRRCCAGVGSAAATETICAREIDIYFVPSAAAIAIRISMDSAGFSSRQFLTTTPPHVITQKPL